MTWIRKSGSRLGEQTITAVCGSFWPKSGSQAGNDPFTRLTIIVWLSRDFAGKALPPG
jgi:hypothetical protein